MNDGSFQLQTLLERLVEASERPRDRDDLEALEAAHGEEEAQG